MPSHLFSPTSVLFCVKVCVKRFQEHLHLLIYEKYQQHQKVIAYHGNQEQLENWIEEYLSKDMFLLVKQPYVFFPDFSDNFRWLQENQLRRELSSRPLLSRIWCGSKGISARCSNSKMDIRWKEVYRTSCSDAFVQYVDYAWLCFKFIWTMIFKLIYF